MKTTKIKKPLNERIDELRWKMRRAFSKKNFIKGYKHRRKLIKLQARYSNESE